MNLSQLYTVIMQDMTILSTALKVADAVTAGTKRLGIPKAAAQNIGLNGKRMTTS